MYPEVRYEVAPKFRGRLQLLYDEWGTLKCETCFQCAQACPIECIDMGGMDTRGRYHVHWGAPEQYGERREESALRRSGRPVPDPAFTAFQPIDLGRGRLASWPSTTHDPKRMLAILEATQAAYGYLPVAALKRISHATGRVVRDDLRHRQLLPASALRAGGRDRAGRRRRARTGPTESDLPQPPSTPRSAGTRAPARRPGPDHGRAAANATGLAAHPARPRRRRRSDRPRCGRRRRRLRRAASSHPRPRRDGDDRHHRRVRAARPGWCRLPGRRQVADRGRRRRPASLRRRQRLRRGPGVAHRPDADGPRPVRGRRGAGHRGLRHRRQRGLPRRACRGQRGHRRAVDGHRPGDRSRSSRRRTSMAPGSTCGWRSVRSRAPTCSARRPSCSRRSRASAGSRSSDRRTPPRAACSGCRPSSTTSRPWPPCRGSCARAPTPTPRSASGPAPGPSSSSCARPAATASPRCRWARRSREVLGLAAKMPRGRSLQALLVGGPSGGLLPPDALDTPYTFDALRAAGAHVGSGSIVAIDDRTDLVELVGVLTRFCSSEACGKSIPCRIGTKRLAELVVAPRGRPGPSDRRRPGRRPGRRHRRLRAVRPRAAGDPPADQRDAILRARRSTAPAGPWRLADRPLAPRPPDDRHASPDPTAAPFPRPTRGPTPIRWPSGCSRPSRRSDRSRHRGSRIEVDGRVRSRASRARPSSRSAATTGSRSRPCATSPSCPASGHAGCASSRSRARSIRRSRARARARTG